MTYATIISMVYLYPKALEMVQRKHGIIRGDVIIFGDLKIEGCSFFPWFIDIHENGYFSTFFIVLMYFQEG